MKSLAASTSRVFLYCLLCNFMVARFVLPAVYQVLLLLLLANNAALLFLYKPILIQILCSEYFFIHNTLLLMRIFLQQYGLYLLCFLLACNSVGYPALSLGIYLQAVTEDSASASASRTAGSHIVFLLPPSGNISSPHLCNSAIFQFSNVWCFEPSPVF